MQYKVPQGVDMQDRILGPLTLIQFGYILFGGLLGYLFYLKLSRPLNLWVALFFLSLSLLISFEYVRRMIAAAVLFVVKPKSRIWHKSTNPQMTIKQPAQRLEIKKDISQVNKTLEANKIARIVDSKGRLEE